MADITIKMLETVKHAGVSYPKDAQLPVAKTLGEHFCDMGWAEDVDGKCPTGERDVHRKKLISPDDVVLMNSVGGA
ncbi:hypothetical protein [Methylophaga lonarensis]|uniref:hypothetical protein n=1 Tax=Methylophaga lonarensis TaxID=999151 RepID=UPI003D27D009